MCGIWATHELAASVAVIYCHDDNSLDVEACDRLNLLKIATVYKECKKVDIIYCRLLQLLPVLILATILLDVANDGSLAMRCRLQNACLVKCVYYLNREIL